MIYAKIWTSEQFGKLSDKAKLLFIGSITLADDDGRLRANSSYLRGTIFPYDEVISVSEVLQLRNEVEKSGLIELYSVDNCEYIQHPKWVDYQIIRKDLYKESTLPTRNESVTKPLRKRATSQVKLSKDKLRQDNTAETSSALIEEVIKLFEIVDAKNKTYYGNTTQRKATVFLLKEYGMDSISRVVEMLPETNQLPYFPNITSPYDLKEKMGKLKGAVDREKNRQDSKLKDRLNNVIW